MFHQVIEEAYPHIIEMLDEICEDGKEEMKRIPTENELSLHQMVAGTFVASFHRMQRL